MDAAEDDLIFGATAVRCPRNAGGKLSVAILPLSDRQYCRTTFSRSPASPG